MQIEQLASELDRVTAEVVQWFEEHGSTRFEYAPADKWSAGQHLEHLIRSSKPLIKALGAPKPFLRISFGKSNGRPVRTYAALKEKYNAGLASGFQAVGQFIPPAIAKERQPDMLDDYAKTNQKLIQLLAKWSEGQMDKYIIPHPALGKLYVREMLYFTIFHTEHHQRLLTERYQSAN